MNWLNYHHLLYFWQVAKTGSIAAASNQLHLSPPTISVQVRQLEESLGQKLLQRSGRGLELTEIGRVAFRYADSIFSTGDALLHAMRSGVAHEPSRLNVGLSEAMPKALAVLLLQPMLTEMANIHVYSLAERTPEQIVAALAAKSLDVVLADCHPPTPTTMEVHSHPLGSSPMAFYANQAHRDALVDGFPLSLQGSQILGTSAGSVLGRGMQEWCQFTGIAPKLAVETADQALLFGMAQAGLGVVMAADVLKDELRDRYQLQRVGYLEGLSQPYFAWSLAKSAVAPVIRTLCQATLARPWLQSAATNPLLDNDITTDNNSIH